MKMRRLMATLCVGALLATMMSVTAMGAEWHPSIMQEGNTVTSIAVTDADGSVTEAEDGDLIVTPKSEMPADEQVHVAYRIAIESSSTVQFLANINLKNQIIEDLGITEDKLNTYEPAALFDVTATGTVLAALQNGGSVDITVAQPGVTASSKVIVLHGRGDVTQADAWEVLSSKAGEGTVTFTMNGDSFSPVMILVQNPDATASSGVSNGNAGTDETNANTGDVNSQYYWIALIAAALLVVVGAAALKSKKQA